jgi:hypothetical protein
VTAEKNDVPLPDDREKAAFTPQEQQVEEVQKPQQASLHSEKGIMEEVNKRFQDLHIASNLEEKLAASPFRPNANHPLPSSDPARVIEAAAGALSNNVGKVDRQSQVTQAGVVFQTFNMITIQKLTKGFQDSEAPAMESYGIPDDASKAHNIADNNDAADSPGEKILEEIQSGSGDAAYVISSRDTPGAGKIKLPATYEEIEGWYVQLSEYERCLVKAASVLHSAPFSAISEATRELYIHVRDRLQTEAPPETSSQSDMKKSAVPATTTETLTHFLLWLRQEEQELMHTTKQSPEASPSRAPAFTGSHTEMLNRTHLYIRRINGAMRLFWEDADEASGISSFSTKLLRFFARETDMERMFALQGESFLDIVKQWPEKYHGELSWRSANALGVIWWYQNARELLWTQASKWAKSSRQQDWGHAAALLDGAFRVEQNEIANNAMHIQNASVLQLLHQWINIAHQATSERGEGYAAARAYALIGRKYPEVALKGLQRLLVFPLNREIKPEMALLQQDLIIKGVLKYIDIVKSGHIRQVLAHLAGSLDQPVSGSILFTSPDIRKSRIQAQQNSNDLQVVLAVFILISSCSLSGVNLQVTPRYSSDEALPDLPICPGREGKDVLLAGLLTEAEQPAWSKQVAILVGALLMEKADEAAFYLLRCWAEIVFRDTGPQARALRQAYQNFLVQVGQQIHAWLNERQSQRFFALGVYKRKLRQWMTDPHLSPRHRFQQMAEQVLTRLP